MQIADAVICSNLAVLIDTWWNVNVEKDGKSDVG